MKKTLLFSLISLSIICSCNQHKENGNETSLSAEEEKDLHSNALAVFSPLPANAEVETNPASQDKIELGYTLFYDKRLSKEGNISCNSCHNLKKFGVDNAAFSKGDDGVLGGRNAPTVLNAALHIAQFWDGRAADVEEQAGMPIMNPVEMAIPHEDFVINRIKEIELYQKLFGQAFPGQEDPISFNNLRLAIGSFERQLLTPSRWDAYLGGDMDALSHEEKEGLSYFMELGCTACHNGETVGGKMFVKFGLHANYWDHTGSNHIDSGRFAHTGNPSDLFVFKVPSLRNIAGTHPYFHDGSIDDLSTAVRVMAFTQLGKELTEEQNRSIVAFLQCMSGTVPEKFATTPPALAGTQ